MEQTYILKFTRDILDILITMIFWLAFHILYVKC